ncbi:hypothetical protein CLOSTASPAR_01461 [[Clostridium] asparagiforme DSM 15981]|uniref:Uncharacterized protein n=1 Tax=[Clostridium] asparagiforme DSM 15981 TaxID=518636 RepID=C0CWU0_9FIRM|nr:hypothetical protein CLOSTASPAR_01461 [[Clostridium] asparagiforme DSM 15981]
MEGAAGAACGSLLLGLPFHPGFVILDHIISGPPFWRAVSAGSIVVFEKSFKTPGK